MLSDLSSIYLIQIPLLTEVATVANVNVYFASSPVPTLIDVPPNDDFAKQYLEESLAAIGYSTKHIRRILITHPHFDHFGSAAWIVDRSEAEVWILRDARNHLEKPKEQLKKDFEYYSSFLNWAGTPEKGEEYLRQFYDIALRLGPAVKVGKCFEEGSTIEFGRSELSVVCVPGHTPWCTLFYDKKKEIAFAGDFLIKGISSNAVVNRPIRPGQPYRSLITYISSLRKVNKFKFRRALPGHGEEIKDVQERIAQILISIERRQHEILSILRARPSNPWTIALKLFPNIANFQVMLGISEVAGHLELLEQYKKVKREGNSAVYRSTDK